MPNNSTQKRGRGWHGDSRGHSQAGKQGGLATARTHDQSYYSEIGRRGGAKSPGNFKNDPDRARAAGKKGGTARSREVF